MPSRTKAPHYRGTYHVRSLALVKAAKANPDTTCWRCGKTLAQHANTRAGRPPRWSAGHLNDGQVDGPLAPEVNTCNSSAGVTTRNHKRKRTDLTW